MSTISTDVGTLTYRVPEPVVAVAQTLGDPWETVPYLYLERLRMTAAPEIDTATLTYKYGPQLRPDQTEATQYGPLDYSGWFCRVTIPDTVGNEDVVWYGIIEPDARAVDGTSHDLVDAHGLQYITAYGLLRLLELEPVRTALVLDHDTLLNTTEIGRGLTFNSDPGGAFSQRANRSAAPVTVGAADSYVFSFEPFGASTWTAWQAAEYLLAHHAPAFPLHTWVMQGNERNLSWYDLSVSTDGRSVKSILDELINRRRGVGYRLEYDPLRRELQIRTFTTLDAELELPGGDIVPANPEIRTLDFEASVDIVQATVNNVPNAKYNRIVCRGAFRTSTCTLTLEEVSRVVDQLIPDWTDAEQDSYLTGPTGLESLEPVEQYRQLDAHRRSDALRNVFSRFLINPAWDQRTINHITPVGSAEYWVAPKIAENGTTLGIYSASPSASGEAAAGLGWWNGGIRFAPYLPLLDGYDYSADTISAGTFADEYSRDGQPEFLPPFGVVRLNDQIDGVPERWEQLDQLSGGQLESAGRPFSIDLSLQTTAPALILTVRGKPQHFLSASTMAGQTVEPEDDPAETGLDYAFCLATVCLINDSRVEESVTLETPPFGAPERVLYLDIPDARLDYVVPHTVVGVVDGSPVQTTSGGFVRDDRPRLADYARCAAEWYGRTRQTLRLTYRQARMLAQIGWLIQDIGATYNLTDVNTPVTALEFEFAGGIPTTTIETSYAALDFS